MEESKKTSSSSKRPRKARAEKKASRKKTSGHKLVMYLNEILSLENASMERLQSRITKISSQDSRLYFQRHLQETRSQINRLRQLVSNFGGKATRDRAQLPILTHAEALDKNMTYPEIELHECEMDLIVENMESVLYDTLLQLLETSGLRGAMSSIIQCLNEERSMAYWLKSNISRLVKQTELAATPIPIAAEAIEGEQMQLSRKNE